MAISGSSFLSGVVGLHILVLSPDQIFTCILQPYQKSVLFSTRLHLIKFGLRTRLDTARQSIRRLLVLLAPCPVPLSSFIHLPKAQLVYRQPIYACHFYACVHVIKALGII